MAAGSCTCSVARIARTHILHDLRTSEFPGTRRRRISDTGFSSNSFTLSSTVVAYANLKRHQCGVSRCSTGQRGNSPQPGPSSGENAAAHARVEVLFAAILTRRKYICQQLTRSTIIMRPGPDGSAERYRLPDERGR